jgi:hypothetical protein
MYRGYITRPGAVLSILSSQNDNRHLDHTTKHGNLWLFHRKKPSLPVIGEKHDENVEKNAYW